MAEMHTENIKKSGEILSGGKLSELIESLNKTESSLKNFKSLLNGKLGALEAEKEKEIQKARETAENIVRDTKFQAEKLIRELEAALKDKNSERFSEMASKAKAEIKSRYAKLDALADPVFCHEEDAVLLIVLQDRQDAYDGFIGRHCHIVVDIFAD